LLLLWFIAIIIYKHIFWYNLYSSNYNSTEKCCWTFWWSWNEGQ